MKKCKDGLNLFYKHLKNKVKKKSVTRIRDDEQVFDKEKKISEVLNRSFQRVQ